MSKSWTFGAYALAGLLVAGGLWLWARWGLAVALSTPAWLCE